MTRILLILTFLVPSVAQASRIKDVSRWEGVETNPVIGIGIVVGLQGTGDGGPAARELLRNAMASLEVDVDPRLLRSKNAAVVTITATLPPFARKGNAIDVTVASLGDARSLSGGVLLPTPLRDMEGRALYAVAEGPLAIGGFSASAGGAAKTKNHTTVGRIPQGGKVVQDVAPKLLDRGMLHLSLRDADFQTAVGMARTINAELLGDFAFALDSGTVRIAVPPQYQGRVTEMAARLEILDVAVDGPARVVINERTGTVVMGSAVRIREVAVAHGGLTIQVDTRVGVSQPGAFSGGSTITAPETNVELEEEIGQLQVLEGVSIGEVVGALNALGVSPRDLMSILQAIKHSGALDAELEVI